jgi:hypothetical protein
MITLRPIDPVAIEKRLESPDALVISGSASTIDAADVDELPPRGRLQQEETSAPLHRQKGRTNVPPDPPWVQANVRVKFALAFVSMPCGTVIGFVSESDPLSRIHQTMATMKRSELRPLSYPARGFSRIAPAPAEALPKHPTAAQAGSG